MVSINLTFVMVVLFILVLGLVIASAWLDMVAGKEKAKNLAVIILCTLIALMVLNIFKQYLKIMGGM